MNYENSRSDFPEDLTGILAEIDMKERTAEIEYRPQDYSTGSRIVNKLFPDDYSQPNINIIPSNKRGNCFNVLFVAIGRIDSCEKRILEAVEHVWVDCPETKYVIFYSAKWDFKAWQEHERGFKKRRSIVVLKQIGQSPLRLRY